ncbi:MAG: O-antigen ligase family protein, partial [Candidatus Riflebacteria bacterium]|nr:O-antigen ligase family protein [Candidatus Riflebacteria bacterium]
MYVIALALSAAMGLRPEVSLPEVLKAKFFLMAWGIAAGGKDRRVLSFLLGVMAVGALYASSYAIYEYHHPGDWKHQGLGRGRVAGPASDTIDFSARLLPVLAFAAGLWAAAPSGSRARPAIAVWCALVGLALAYSSTRSNLVGLIVSLLVGASVTRRSNLLAIALAVSCLAAIPSSSLTERYVAGGDATSNSDQYRLDVFRVGLSIARDHFPLGVGRSNFVLAHDQRKATDQVSKLSSHNNYLDLLCETGLLGLAAFLCFHRAFLSRVLPPLRECSGSDPLREGV